MRYPAVLSAVFIAVAAAPALAAPSGLGVRALEEDALAQRSFDDELYARDLIFGRADTPARPGLHRSNAVRRPHRHAQHPPQRDASKRLPSSPKPAAPNPQQRRELDELYARDPMDRGRPSGRVLYRGPPSRPPQTRLRPSGPVPVPQRPRRPHGANNLPTITLTSPQNHQRDLDEHLFARATEEDELFARAWEDAVFARMDVDDLD
ncbi:uncharacterized protein B0H18DRAFT_1023897 [Fomitopsis serialis]|uniref:uncharacterized protein n=1 Tax=Fomitopsis serialis TaxID=139415 RepID=UPI0020075352|nr:uncharacterized protein B0H18DRAFT_1023897 [Neoantrodia serialis]KAH9920434.1 hypothetical protein B0H18DRAFT_1023897 [Neoantrodia serialis]